MKQSKFNQRITMISLAVAGVLGSAGVASAQYQIDTSRATDANRRVGSAGFNDSVITREYGAANLVTNNLVNGNITAGRGFRGSLGYADTRAFRGQLPSSSIDRFVQGSSGITTGGLPSFNSNVVRPYYGVGRGVNLPTAGSGDGAFTRDIGGGGFVPATSRTFDPADGRIDYGGLDSALVQRSAFDTTRVANPLPASSQRYQMLSTSVRYRDAARLDPGGSVFLSEYTRIVRGSSLTPAEAKAVAELRERVSGTPAVATDAPPVEAGTSVGLTVRRAGEAARPAGVKPGDNTQLDALRERFKLVGDSTPTLPGAENAEQIRQLNAERIAERDAAARAEREAARSGNRATPPVRVAPVSPTSPAAPATSPESAPPTPVIPDPAAPSDPSVPVVAPTTDVTSTPDAKDAATTQDGSTMTIDTPARTVVPGVEIKSFAAGISEPAVASVMQRAEKLLAEGRYASAIIEIDNAELLAPRDPMLKLARSIAQLGGGYYRQAEISMREALDLDQALLVARYDLVVLIGEKRLETIRTDLARIAGESPADPGPLLMLAFVAHQTEPGTRGVELLRRAQGLSPADPLLPAILRVWEVSK